MPVYISLGRDNNWNNTCDRNLDDIISGLALFSKCDIVETMFGGWGQKNS